MIIISFLLFFLELSLSCLPLKRQKPGIDTLSVRRLSICYLFFLTLSPSIILSIYLPKAVTLSCVTPSFIYPSFFSLTLSPFIYLSIFLPILLVYICRAIKFSIRFCCLEVRIFLFRVQHNQNLNHK